MSKSDMLTITAQDEKIASLVPSGAVAAMIAEGDFAFGLARTWNHLLSIQAGKP